MIDFDYFLLFLILISFILGFISGFYKQLLGVLFYIFIFLSLALFYSHFTAYISRTIELNNNLVFGNYGVIDIITVTLVIIFFYIVFQIALRFNKNSFSSFKYHLISGFLAIFKNCLLLSYLLFIINLNTSLIDNFFSGNSLLLGYFLNFGVQLDNVWNYWNS